MSLSRAARSSVDDTPVVDINVARQAHHGQALTNAQQAQRSTPPSYSPTTSLEKIARSALPPESILKLDWNEGTIPPPPSVAAAMIAHIQSAGGHYLKWYPQLSGGPELQAELADYCGVREDNILVTNGSDDALILLCHAFLGPGRSALAPTPTYEHFCVNVLGTGAQLIRFEVEDPFLADEDEIAAGIARHRPTMAYLVSPNNPTGVQWTAAQVHDLATRFPDVIFLVDEAYHEFGEIDPTTGRPVTCSELAVTMKNVVVTRTFSKAFCLASVRCGYIIAHPATLATLRPYYNPKSVNQFAQVAALAALRERDSYYRPYIEATNAERLRFTADLEALGVDVRSGGAGNFVCVRVPDGRTAELCARLEEHAIYVRDIDSRFPGYVRITIGLEMDRVTQALATVLADMGVLPRPPHE